MGESLWEDPVFHCLRREPFWGEEDSSLFLYGVHLLLSFSSTNCQAFFHILIRGYTQLDLRGPRSCPKPVSADLRTLLQLAHPGGEHQDAVLL